MKSSQVEFPFGMGMTTWDGLPMMSILGMTTWDGLPMMSILGNDNDTRPPQPQPPKMSSNLLKSS
eukprot:5217426-Amphidinium_carterae.1